MRDAPPSDNGGQENDLVYSPERSTDTILPSHIGRLKKGGGPRPLTHDDTGRKTSFNRSTGGAALEEQMW